MNKIIISVITSLLLVAFLIPVYADNDNNPCNKPLKIRVHVEDFPTGVEVEAGTDDGQSKTKTSNGDTVTFIFKGVDVGEGIYATVDGATDYGTNTAKCEPEDLYPKLYPQNNNNDNNNNLFEDVDVEQQAQCNIYGNNNECNIGQNSEIGTTEEEDEYNNYNDKK